MRCPYCIEEIADEATVCKVCRRDLQMVLSLQKRVAELEAVVALSQVAPQLPAEEEEQPAQLSNARWLTEALLVIAAGLAVAGYLLTRAIDSSSDRNVALWVGAATIPSIVTALFLNIRLQATWRVAVGVAILNSLTAVTIFFNTMLSFAAGIWGEPKSIGLLGPLVAANVSDPKSTGALAVLVLSPASVFLAAFWLGTKFRARKKNASPRAQRVAGRLIKQEPDEGRRSYEARIKTMTTLLSALGPLLTLIGTVVTGVLTYLTALNKAK